MKDNEDGDSDCSFMLELVNFRTTESANVEQNSLYNIDLHIVTAMPFNKFRPLKQWGRHNTRLFRQLYKKKLSEESPPLVIPKWLNVKNLLHVWPAKARMTEIFLAV